MRFEVHKTKRAEDDLLDIWLYGARRWGEEQADQYVDLIGVAAARLSDDQKLGSDYGHVRIGYRRISVGRHRIFHVLDEDRVMIVRILHERMDVEAQLRG